MDNNPIDKTEIPYLRVQWHITTNCGNKCRHCYMFEEATYEEERKNTLPLKDLIRIYDSIEAFEKKWGLGVKNFAVSGGDPLLRPDWKEFIAHLRNGGREVVMMGNPETLTEDNVRALAGLGVKAFQMSLDGLEETHDYFRSPGSFKRAINSLDRLKAHGIRSNIMFTLYPNNANQLIPLLNFVARETTAKAFSFDVGCHVGNASGIAKNFNNEDLHDILARYLEEKKRLREEGYPLEVAEKSNLLKLIRWEKKEFYPWVSPNISIISGCSTGWSSASILSDGTMLACRRMPVKVGKMPEQSFEEVFLGSEVLKKFRRPQYYKGCGTCDFYPYCRGCPANAHSMTGDPFSRHPQCFRDRLPSTTAQQRKIPAGPPLSTTFEEEFQWLKTSFQIYFKENFKQILDDKSFQLLYMDLYDLEDKKKKFLEDPRAFLNDENIQLSDDAVFFLMSHFGKITNGLESDEQENPVLDYILTSLAEEIYAPAAHRVRSASPK